MCQFCSALGARDASGGTAVDGSGAADFESLIYSDFVRHDSGGPLGSEAIVTYSFARANDFPPVEAAYTPHSYRTMAKDMKEATRLALAEYERHTGLKFVEVADDGNLDFMLATGAAGYSWAYYPLGREVQPVVINQQVANLGLDGGETLLQVLLHEIGHAVGLKHPFEGFPVLRSSRDNTDNTVMSYTDGPGTVRSLGPIDIRALNYLYGGPDAFDGYRIEVNEQRNTATIDANGKDQRIALDGYRLVVDARGGNDTVVGSDMRDTLRGNDGADLLDGGGMSNPFGRGSGNDHAFSDLLEGGAGLDTLEGWRGHDTLLGGGGGDTAWADDGNDSLFGGDGNDSLAGGWGTDTVRGGVGRDTLDGGLGNDVLNGSYDADSIVGGDGYDEISGGRGNDRIVGGARSDTLIGDGGADTILGGEGGDVADGGFAGDTIRGEAGADDLLGGPGHDLINGGDGADLLDGEGGRDTLNGADAFDTITGGAGKDAIHGGRGGDSLVGGSYADSILGAEGSDALIGGEGNDTIGTGAGGNDTVEGGRGRDSIALGLGGGTDVVVFATGDDVDTVTGFGRNDRLDVAVAGVARTDLPDVARQVGDDVRFVFGGGDTIILENVALSLITDEVFV